MRGIGDRGWSVLATVLATLCVAACLAGLARTGSAAAAVSRAQTTTTTASTPPPANDDRDSAQALGALPVTVNGTTAGSTLETNEPSGDCNVSGTVWYSETFTTPVPDTAGIRVDAGGNLDACVDVFIKQRSQVQYVTGAGTDNKGVARLTFTPQAKTTYLIRVGQLYNSDPGPFSLELFSVPPPASAPGAALPAAGARGQLDSFFTTTAAYSTQLSAATTYKINLVNRAGGCMSLKIYGPAVTDFANASADAGDCGGYRLFTPQTSGVYSFLITAAGGLDVEQPYALVVEPASSAEMAPGIPLANLTTAKGLLRGNVDTAVRLYRLQVDSRSQLTLTLDTRSDASFDLELLGSGGRVIDCQCGDSGDESIQEITRPGTYYAAVKATAFSFGRFSLSRQSRTITGLGITTNGIAPFSKPRHRHGASHPVTVTSPLGAEDHIDAHIGPAVSGHVSFEIEYFDPLSGWQFRGDETASLIGGVAALGFTPTEPGRWRAMATFAGTETAAPSTSPWSYLNVSAPDAG